MALAGGGGSSHDDRVSCTAGRCGRLPAVSLLTELDAFFTEHGCGDLDAGVDDMMVWIACDCGASMARRVDDDDRRAAG
jgi:hypothetical protein